MKTSKIIQIHSKFLFGSNRLDEIESTINNMKSQGFNLTDAYSIIGRKFLILPVPSTILIFEQNE